MQRQGKRLTVPPGFGSGHSSARRDTPNGPATSRIDGAGAAPVSCHVTQSDDCNAHKHSSSASGASFPGEVSHKNASAPLPANASASVRTRRTW